MEIYLNVPTPRGMETGKFLLLSWCPRGCLAGGKAAGRWSRPLISICAKVENEWNYISISPYFVNRCIEIWIKKQPPTCTCWHFVRYRFWRNWLTGYFNATYETSGRWEEGLYWVLVQTDKAAKWHAINLRVTQRLLPCCSDVRVLVV